eukprot:TRINITY_DN54499_c0_g1_i1.p1 TRINITY_DN54499_c0_g1~~TRINITY_DN54499_c0_g1_i1.p1  ORF type:complete len:799 (+),score=138.22 TRINITY_DN54499_c0_g1_i1:100-2496(+)
MAPSIACADFDFGHGPVTRCNAEGIGLYDHSFFPTHISDAACVPTTSPMAVRATAFLRLDDGPIATPLKPLSAGSSLQYNDVLSALSPSAIKASFRRIVSPEVTFYKWCHDYIIGPSLPTSGQGRFVQYNHTGLPESHQQDAVWWDAVQKWNALPSDVSGRAVWQQRICVDDHGKPGPDADECYRQGVHTFPLVRFFPAGSNVGQDYEGALEPDPLVDFAQQWSKLDEAERTVVPGQEGHDVGYSIVNYATPACPSCQKATPSWEEAAKTWDGMVKTADVPLVDWQSKECDDKGANGGQGTEECALQQVVGFPSTKLTRPNVHDATKTESIQYSGPRTAQGYLNFVRDGVGLHEAAVAAKTGDGHSVTTTADLANATRETVLFGHKSDANGHCTSDKNPMQQPTVLQVQPQIDDEELDRAVLDEGYDHKIVNYYAAAGPRSKRLDGIFQLAQRRWEKAVDPDEDAMFIAGLRHAEQSHSSDHNGASTRLDPPNVWWEQRECFDDRWRPGRDYEHCRRQGVLRDGLPAIRLFSATSGSPSVDDLHDVHDQSPHFVANGVDFHGQRTLRGILDFLGRETGLEQILENRTRYIRNALGSDTSARIADGSEQAFSARDRQKEGAAIIDALKRDSNILGDLAATAKHRLEPCVLGQPHESLASLGDAGASKVHLDVPSTPSIASTATVLPPPSPSSATSAGEQAAASATVAESPDPAREDGVKVAPSEGLEQKSVVSTVGTGIPAKVAAISGGALFLSPFLPRRRLCVSSSSNRPCSRVIVPVAAGGRTVSNAARTAVVGAFL